MPWYALALMLSGATIIGLLRLATWIARAAGYRANKRPGYIPIGRKQR